MDNMTINELVEDLTNDNLWAQLNTCYSDVEDNEESYVAYLVAHQLWRHLLALVEQMTPTEAQSTWTKLEIPQPFPFWLFMPKPSFLENK
tara:strand:+ start:699 stop:968 length:270 start_codon:yes stop_codon:yes gene_type:complete